MIRDLLPAPKPWIYFLASQLQHLKGWAAAYYRDPVYKLLWAHTKGSAQLLSLEAGFPALAGGRFPTINLSVKVWGSMKVTFHIESCTPYASIWHKPILSAFYGLQGFSAWENAGISLVSHL